MVKVLSVKRRDASTVMVRVSVPFEAWKHAAKTGNLGFLYGVDISNLVYRTHGVAAYNPTVDDTARPLSGVKFIDLYYQDAAWVERPLADVIRVDFKARRRITEGETAQALETLPKGTGKGLA